MEYEARDLKIEAFQAGYDEYPEWFRFALVCGIAWIDTYDGGIVIGNSNFVSTGDWIVKGLGDELMVWPQDTFSLYFQEVENE